MALVLGTIMAGGILLSLTHTASNLQFDVTATSPPQGALTLQPKALAVLGPTNPSPNGRYLLISEHMGGEIPSASHLEWSASMAFEDQAFSAGGNPGP